MLPWYITGCSGQPGYRAFRRGNNALPGSLYFFFLNRKSTNSLKPAFVVKTERATLL